MLAGAGIATLPTIPVEDDLMSGCAVEVVRPWKVASVAVRAAWPQTTVKAALTQHFLDFIGPRVIALFA